ncbi:uridine diphosphate-N-acetylglucosamine-binding protein YvcK [Shewanella sp. AS16]|uniref:uridine diphosphate-N-acetylglucosamine-binding protein YvcK n=1 Tax=Shewanella sp. AS16 TaxID=2907625 RepID=UPI001F40A4C1|nr:uridine diphosphate-N-acetylglucosamine-binding protein YvcK [Shewanella sp. AS16]MCE9687369.1 uridine diphosphate-N-acetylglucosamine-binding protein YvcK [Shewanella sp. AS16]
MQHHNLNQYNKIVAIGGGHGLGRVLSSLAFLGSRVTGIVATTDNGGSTGRLRANQDCIAWGDLRNCLSHLAGRPSIGSLLFEYRFEGDSELSGHNLGNLILLALDQLCVRPLEAVNLIRNLLKIETRLIPMSEQPTHLVALSTRGDRIFGELNVDGMSEAPIALSLEPLVDATCEACVAVQQADLIILGPGSFLTSVLPPLLMPKLAQQLAASRAEVIFIDNLAQECSPAGTIDLEQKLAWCHQLIGKPVITKVLCHGEQMRMDGKIGYFPLRSKHSPGLHDRAALADAIAALVTSPRLIA